MLIGTLGASFLWSLFTGKGTMTTGAGNHPPHLLTNFEIQKYYYNEPKFDGVYSINNLPEIKDGGICKKSWLVY